MARIAFVMDRPLRKIGLSGKSFVSMLIGFGCSVPAVMSSRTLSSDRDTTQADAMSIPMLSKSLKKEPMTPNVSQKISNIIPAVCCQQNRRGRQGYY